MIFEPVIPIPWIVCIALTLTASTIFFQYQSAKRLGYFRNAFLLIVRLVALGIIVFLLLQPAREQKIPVPDIEKTVLFAVDVSSSMAEANHDGSSRIDAARADLEKAGVFHDNNGLHRFYSVAEKAQPMTSDSLRLAAADVGNTRFDNSITQLLRMTGQSQPAALFILSDGHDFDLVAPGETASRALARDIPIFTIPYGTLESSRDVSIRIANYHPHTFIRQTTKLEAFVRSLGCEYELLNIDLLKNGEKVDSARLDTGNKSFHNVSFNVTHEEPGQYEYTFRVSPIINEKELSNNTTTTYLNVISERIRVLEIEGNPFWDSTFLRRSFARNDKFDIDSLVAFTNDRVKPIRSNPDRNMGELKPPAKAEDLRPYNMVIFGRDVERVIGADGIRAVDEWVKNHGGLLVFSRGRAWGPELNLADELEPIEWDTLNPSGTRLEVTPQAGSVPAFRMLREVASVDEFPEVISFPAKGEAKTLATTFSVDEKQAPAIVYRRYGSGQTISLGVGNLWRWVFNPKAEYENNAYDRFWDQLTLWLLANGGVTPIQGYSFRTNAANLPLGESVHLRLTAHGIEPPASPPVISIFKDDEPVTTMQLTAGKDPSISHAELAPQSTGKYRATVTLPDGKSLSTQFIVFRENNESTETAMDKGYLEQLAKASGGRMIDGDEIADIVTDLLRDNKEQEPLTRKVPLWDKPQFYLLICFLLGMEWYARRRWGLT